MTARVLTDTGIQNFREYLVRLRGGDTAAPPRELLDAPDSSAEFHVPVEIEHRSFASRLDAARYLFGKLGGKGQVDYNSGLWSWLALFYFDQICPPLENGKRQAGEEARYIPGTRSWRYYRHLLAGPFRVYKLHRECAKVLLSGPLDKPGDFMEQLASRQELITNPAIVGAAAHLYFDEKNQRPKRGAASTKRKPGTLRRFVDLVQQLDLTYDLYSMQPAELVQLLPKEFDVWRSPESRYDGVRTAEQPAHEPDSSERGLLADESGRRLM